MPPLDVTRFRLDPPLQARARARRASLRPAAAHPAAPAAARPPRSPPPPSAADASRHRPPAQAKRGDPAAWRAALDNAHAQLEHQLARIANLELLLKFGPNTWRAQAGLSGAAAKQLEAQLAATRKQVPARGRLGGPPARRARAGCRACHGTPPPAPPNPPPPPRPPPPPPPQHPPPRQIDGLNRERKVQQMAAGNELRRLEDEWATAVRKNLEVTLACEKLGAEVRMLRAQLPPEDAAALEAAEAAAAAGPGGMNGQNGGDAMAE